MALLSIIVPCYNAQKYLEKCALSILNQTVKDIEVIFVNDGSVDETLNILNALKKDERVVVINQENLGPARAVINGIKNSNGDYIGFVDSDDWISDNMFEVLLQNLQKQGADMVQCGALVNGTDITDDFTSRKECVFNDIKQEIIKPFFEEKATLYPITNARWNKIYKRKLLAEIIDELNTDFFIGEDLTLNLKYLYSCKKAVVLKDENNYNYRCHGESISRKHTCKKQNSFLKMFEELKKLADRFGYSGIAVEYAEKDGICSLMLDTLLSDFTFNEKEKNLRHLYNTLQNKEHIKEYAKNRPFSARVVLSLIGLKMFKTVTLISILTTKFRDKDAR